jgi:predicted DNA-binding transcriptional regulator YafY
LGVIPLFSKLQDYDDNPFYSKIAIEDLSDKQHLFSDLQSAITNKKIVEFIYKDKTRLVKPYKIVSFDGYWYLYCEDMNGCKLKTYYFKDIVKVIIKNETFKSNLYAHEKLKYAINAWFDPSSEPFEVALLVEKVIAPYFIRRPLSLDQRIIKIHSDGSMEIALNVTSQKEILHEIKKWMPELVVISPKSTIDLARNIAEGFLWRQGL